MRDIPSEVLREILSRVPAEPLLRFRCVCKPWRSTIDDPIFIRLHLDRHLLKIQDSSSGVGQVILRGDLDTSFYSLSLESLNSNGGINVTATRLNHNLGYRNIKSPVGSCNGVMLISDSNGKYLLWNPLTRDFHSLPTLKLVMSKKLGGLYHSIIGFGYDLGADDYKVVKVAQVFDPRNRSLRSESFVYSLKLDCWSRIKDIPYRISRLSRGVFLKGALHWISSTKPLKSMDDLIIGLELTGEDYCLIPLPYELAGQKKRSAMHLGVLGGCLILSCYYQIERLDVWLMKDYGVEDSWIKLFSVGAIDNVGAVETLRPIAYSKLKEEVLLQRDRQEFLWFDLKTKLGKSVKIHGQPTTFSSQLCFPSLARLNGNNGDGEHDNAERQARDKYKLTENCAIRL